MSDAVTTALSRVHYDSFGAVEFETEAEVIAFVDGVYEKFPPIGYGTRFARMKCNSYTKFVASGTSFSSGLETT